MMEFSLTQKGNHVVLYEGYEYAKYRANESGVITWRCRAYFATKCRAFLKTKEETIIGDVPKHSHDSFPQKARANILKTAMKEYIKAFDASPKNVMENVLSGVSTDVLEHLPKQSSLTRNLFKHKVKTYIPNPTTVNFPIPEKYADLILHDTGVDDPERILVIGNNNLVAELKKDLIFGDGTFDENSSMFYQLYTWHAKVGKAYPPCIYFLLQKKNMPTYKRMFTILKQLVPGIAPQEILVDFEKDCISAAKNAFPQAEVKGCYFHLYQSLLRKIDSAGLKGLYESDIEVKLKLKSLPALSFVPIPDVKNVFNQLVSTFPDEDKFNDVLSYFCTTYVEGVAGRSPLFPISMWNHSESVAEETPKTINFCEGFQHTLNSLFHCRNPSVWKLFDGLKRDIACQRLLLSNVHMGRLVKKKKHEALNNQVALIMQDYVNQEDKLIFLRRMAAYNNLF